MFKKFYSLIEKRSTKRKKKKRKEMKKKKYNDAKNIYDEYGYNKYGFDRDGYNRGGFDKYGFDKQGYNKDGYNRFGFNKDGYSYSGYDRDGYDREGYDRNGYDKHGLDRHGYDKQGYNVSGENKQGIFYFNISVKKKEYLQRIHKGSFLRIKREINNLGEIINISVFYDRYYIGNVPPNILNVLAPQINQYNIANFTCSVVDLYTLDGELKIDIRIKRAFFEDKNEESDLKEIAEYKVEIDKEIYIN